MDDAVVVQEAKSAEHLLDVNRNHRVGEWPKLCQETCDGATRDILEKNVQRFSRPLRAEILHHVGVHKVAYKSHLSFKHTRHLLRLVWPVRRPWREENLLRGY